MKAAENDIFKSDFNRKKNTQKTVLELRNVRMRRAKIGLQKWNYFFSRNIRIFFFFGLLSNCLPHNPDF